MKTVTASFQRVILYFWLEWSCSLSGVIGINTTTENSNGLFYHYQRGSVSLDTSTLEKRDQKFWSCWEILFSVHFFFAVFSATPAKPCVILTHPQLWCNHSSSRGSNRCLQRLCGCRCLLCFCCEKNHACWGSNKTSIWCQSADFLPLLSRRDVLRKYTGNLRIKTFFIWIFLQYCLWYLK